MSGLTSYISMSVKIDWNNNGSYSDTDEDVSTYARFPLTTKRGRSKATDQFGAGTGTLILKNEDGRFTRDYSSSPLYPNVLPGRSIKIQCTYNGTTYDVFTGKCSPDSQVVGPPSSVQFSMLDAFEQFRQGLTRTDILTGKTVAEIITAILDDISWSASARSLDTGPEAIGYFPNHNRLPINALQLAAAQDPGAAIFMDRAGNVAYQNRYYRSSQAIYATLTGTWDALDPQIRMDDLVDNVRSTYPRYSLSGTLAAVYTQNLALPLTSGSGTVDFEVNASGIVAASGYVTPLVATTDFVANSARDGGGTDKTAQVSISISASDSGGGTLSWTNLDSTTVYLTTLQVRGYGLSAGSESDVVKVAVAAPIITGQTLQTTFDFLDRADTVTGYTYSRAASLSNGPRRPVVTITPDTDALMAIVLGAEIGKKVVLVDTGATWLTQLNRTFTIENIEMNFETPAKVTAKWTLLDTELTGGNMFRISGASGGGQDYSTIAAAGATSGDRIGF